MAAVRVPAGCRADARWRHTDFRACRGLRCKDAAGIIPAAIFNKYSELFLAIATQIAMAPAPGCLASTGYWPHDTWPNESPRTDPIEGSLGHDKNCPGLRGWRARGDADRRHCAAAASAR